MNDTQILDWIQANASRIGIKPEWQGCPIGEPEKAFEFTDIRQMAAKTAGRDVSSQVDAIKKAINECIDLLGGDHVLMCLVGSWGDTLSDEDVLSGLERWRDLFKERRDEAINHSLTIYNGDA